MSDDIVHFLMPDGTKVSNDPSFDMAKARQEMLDATEYTGSEGVPRNEIDAQTQVTHVASLNSAQPGVGENSAPADPTTDLHGPLGSPAMQRQTDDLAKAQADGASPAKTSVKDAEPVDSNEAVLEARAAAKARAEAAQAALEEAGEEPGDPEVPYSEWSAKQLKAEVAIRNADRAEEDQLETKGLKKKSELADLLDADDAALAAAAETE